MTLRRAIEAILGGYRVELERAVGASESLLDVGCGADSPLRHLRRRPARLVGVDGHRPSLEASRRRGIHDEYFEISVLEIDRHFVAGSFDCVVALDLIEHLPKAEGLELIHKMATVSAGRVVLFTPNGFLPQGEYGDNPYQRHRSGWTVDEIRQLGFEVIGINGWKALRGERSALRFRPRVLWGAVSWLTQPIVRNRPEHAFQLLCVRRGPVPQNEEEP